MCGLSLSEIEKHDHGRIADRGEMAGEGKASGPWIPAEGSDGIASLVARVEEIPAGIGIEAARVVPTGPFLSSEGEGSSFPDRKDPDAVMQAVARVDEPAIGRNHDLGGKAGAGEPRRQAG